VTKPRVAEIERLLETLPPSRLRALAATLALEPRTDVEGPERPLLVRRIADHRDVTLRSLLFEGRLRAADVTRAARALGARTGRDPDRVARRVLAALVGWRSFAAARQAARRLWLRTRAEWTAYCRGERPDLGSLPLDVPPDPERVYAGEGWSGWRDWLGPTRLQASTAELEPGEGFRDWHRARDFARSLGLRHAEQWAAFSRGALWREVGERPPDVPGRPSLHYGETGEWTSKADWLGLGPMPYADARRFVLNLGLRSVREWRVYSRGDLAETHGLRPLDLPGLPENAYPDEWTGYSDWLAAPSIRPRRPPRDFAAARAFARSLGLPSGKAWVAYCHGQRPDLPRLPDDVPTNPQRVYAGKGWAGMGDWLGTDRAATQERVFRDYAAAAAYVQSLGLRSQSQYRAWFQGERADLPPPPDDLPSHPNHTYGGRGWSTWGAFLGTGAVSTRDRRFRSYLAARALVRELGLRSLGEYVAWALGERPDLPPCPDDMPGNPEATYRKAGAWAGRGDFFGTGVVAPKDRRFRSFVAARRLVRGLGLRNMAEYRAWCQGRRPDLPPRPADVPTNPQRTYASEWRGNRDWFGTEGRRRTHRRWAEFEPARRFARGLGLRTWTEWRAWCRADRPDLPPRPDWMPTNPWSTYRECWRGMPDWLGAPPRGGDGGREGRGGG